MKKYSHCVVLAASVLLSLTVPPAMAATQYISNDTNIESIEASGGEEKRTTPGDVFMTTNSDISSRALYAHGAGKIYLDGNLSFDYTGKKGFDSFFATGAGSQITLAGKENTIDVKSTTTSISRWLRLSGGAKALISGDKTTVTADDQTNQKNGLQLANVTDGSELHVSNGKSGADSSLFIANSNSAQKQVLTQTGGKAYFDRVQMDGTSTGANGRIFNVTGTVGASDDQQASITFLGGSFNKNTTTATSATALEASQFGRIEALGYDGGTLEIETGAANQPGIVSVGGAGVSVNTSKSARFTTTIQTSGNNYQHGIAAGILPTTGTEQYAGMKYGGSSAELYGTTHIDVKNDRSYALKVTGDGTKVGLYGVDGQTESTLHAATTAIKFGSANGYSYNADGTPADAGGQIVHLEKTTVANDGVEADSNNNGVYTGHLIQVGSHGQEITVDGIQRNLTNVADAVKNATLNLIDSTATANDAAGKDLIHVTYGGGTTRVPDTVASDIAVNAAGSTLSGAIFTDYTPDSSGEASSLRLTLTDGSVWNVTRDSSTSNDWLGTSVTGNFVTGLTLDNSAVVFSHIGWDPDDAASVAEAQRAEHFKTLYVAGDYHGHDGTLYMNVVLSDDASPADKLVVGGSTSGTTGLFFTNVGGEGAETVNGIKVVEVLGDSNGAFTKDNALVAGIYEYNLVKGDASGNTNDWYLTSYIRPPDPPVDPDVDPVRVYRPEAGSYLGNAALAGDMFALRLDEREAHIMRTKEDADKRGSVWLIGSYANTEQKYGNGQLQSDADLWQLRLGYDIANRINARGRQTVFGVMASYAHGSQKSKSIYTPRTSKGEVDGFLAGLYGTWYENADTRIGWYVDGWAQYGWFDNTVKGDGLARETYDTEGWGLSLEFGKSFLHRETSDRRYFWQPKVQLVYTDLSQDDVFEANGTRISFGGDSNLMTRVGLRWAAEQKPGVARKDSFFIEANWLHNSDAYNIASMKNVISANGAEDLGELRLGFEKELSDTWRLWANLTGRWGQDGYRQLGGMLSLEYRF